MAFPLSSPAKKALKRNSKQDICYSMEKVHARKTANIIWKLSRKSFFF